MVTIIKPVKFDGLMVIRTKSKRKSLKDLEQSFRGFAKRNKIQIEVERKGKLAKVV
jgi:hypothetical protein